MSVVDCQGSDFYQLSTEVLGRGSSLRFRAHGRSMEPFIRDGDLIEVVPSSGLGFRPGDIAFYWTTNGQPRAHRVVKEWVTQGEKFLQTFGDNASRPDPPVRAEQVLGMVVAVQRDGKWLELNRGFLRAAGIVWGRTRGMRRVVNPCLLRMRRFVTRLGRQPLESENRLEDK